MNAEFCCNFRSCKSARFFVVGPPEIVARIGQMPRFKSAGFSKPSQSPKQGNNALLCTLIVLYNQFLTEL